MKIRNLLILVAVCLLGVSAQGCGLSSARVTNSPTLTAPLAPMAPTTASMLPATTPTQDAQVTESMPTANTKVDYQGTATLPDPTSTTVSQSTESANIDSTAPTLEPAIDINGDGQIDICEAIPKSVLEQTLGRSLTGPGQPFMDESLGNGCAFDFGSDSNEVYFAYVTIATEKQFSEALASAVNAEPVTTIGDSAFLNYGPDARQLWIRVGDQAVLVAIGDRENVPAAMIFAQYMVEFVKVSE